MKNAEHSGPVIESDRLTMRSLESADESFYCSLYTDTEVMRYVGAPLGRPSAQEAFRKSLELMSSPSFQRRVVVLVDRKSQRPVGISSVRLVDAKRGRAEVGTLLKPEAQEQGFALECSEALIEQAFTRPQIQELLAYSASGNSPIQGLLQELGFKRGRVRKADKGRPERVAWLLTRADWANRSSKKKTK
jgi:RimJ/RimL family protein N-acetyltransferase